jgi:hypothetical protein
MSGSVKRKSYERSSLQHRMDPRVIGEQSDAVLRTAFSREAAAAFFDGKSGFRC